MGGENDGEEKPEIGVIHTVLHENDGARAAIALKPGELFANRYRIEALIGEGGFGSVYRVLDQTADTHVALKLLKTDRLVTPEARRRLIREALLARNIRHPNIVAVYDVGEDTGQPYIAMELLTGRSLRSWIREHASGDAECAFATAQAIVLAVLDGLDAAHQQNVVHRDLKPENIFLIDEPSGDRVRLKLLDFGVAHNAGDTPSTGGMSGPYMAPEQITTPDAVKASADLYALSVIFYELLIGVLPHGRWQAPSKARSDVPVAIDAIIEAGLNNRPRSRPQSVAEMRGQLLPVKAQAKPEPSEAPGADMVKKADGLYADGWGFGGEYPEARDNYYIAAVLGNVAGMVGSAKMLARGHGGPVDERMARVWLTKAAELGSKEAIQRLARFDELVAEGKASQQPQPAEPKPKPKPTKPASQEQIDAASAVFDGMFGKETKKPAKPRAKPAEPKSADPEALRKEAMDLYQSGKGPNLPRARELFRQGAELGDANAMYHYAMMLTIQQGGNRDRETGHRWFTRAAEAGESGAAIQVARNFGSGLGAEKNEAQARLWYEKAAHQDEDAGAMTELGQMMRNGQGGAKDLEGARKWLKKASDRRQTLASHTLGLMWHNGEGGPKDLAQAREYHRRAAEGGLAAGQLLYGIYLQNGYGGPENKAEAREWYRKAADAGATNAIAYYGLMLDRGEGGPKDSATARTWLKRSSEAGDKLGMFGYGVMLMDGSGGPKDEAAAREWLKKSGDGGMTDAYAYYAQLLFDGRGGPKDKVQAKHYAKIAADGGSENGKKLLARFW